MNCSVIPTSRHFDACVCPPHPGVPQKAGAVIPAVFQSNSCSPKVGACQADETSTCSRCVPVVKINKFSPLFHGLVVSLHYAIHAQTAPDLSPSGHLPARRSLVQRHPPRCGAGPANSRERSDETRRLFSVLVKCCAQVLCVWSPQTSGCG